MPSTGTLGGTLSPGPESLKVKRQACPHDGSRGLKRPAPASPPVTDNHHGAGAKGAAGVAGRPKNFLVDIGATYSVLISYSRAFSSQTCSILGVTGKASTKRFTPALLCCWDGQIFSHQFLVVTGKTYCPGGSDGKVSVYNAGDPGSIPGLGRSPGEGNGNPLQYYCLENPMDRGAW